MALLEYFMYIIILCILYTCVVCTIINSCGRKRQTKNKEWHGRKSCKYPHLPTFFHYYFKFCARHLIHFDNR